MTLVLQEPPYIKQNKLANCWYACLRMLFAAHGDQPVVTSQNVKNMQSGFKGNYATRRYVDINHVDGTYLSTKGYIAEDLSGAAGTHIEQPLSNANDIENFLRRHGPFVGGGEIFKPLPGVRIAAGHAILIYGVENNRILHHDPWSGRAVTIGINKYIARQDHEVIWKRTNPTVSILRQS